ncbi:MAG: hypothetical protein ACI31C_08955 [Muribaculaceae bacterium]
MAYFYRYILLLLALLAMSCSDDIDVPSHGYPTGEPTTLTVGISLGEASQHSRGEMQEGLDEVVTSLWVGVYNADQGYRTGSRFITDIYKSLNHTMDEVTLNTLSGRSIIVAVANYDYRYAIAEDGSIISISEALEAADTYEKYLNIAIALDRKGNYYINTPLNPLLMSGVYTESADAGGEQSAATVVDIAPGMSKPSGAIHLRRLVSHIRFNIRFNSETVSSYALRSYRIVNLPALSWLHERSDEQQPVNAPDIKDAVGYRYGETKNQTTFMLVEDQSMYTFDYWTMENKRTGREECTTYADREKEYKNDDGSNSGKYVSLVDAIDSDDVNNMAQYVVFNVSLEMKVDENGNAITDGNQRLVEAEFVVHIGYCEGATPARDFNCLRNSEYVYNVTINNFNDIMVEANRLGEPTPSLEGFITDITDSHFIIDAHYNAFNIFLSEDNMNAFSFITSAVDMNGDVVIVSSHYPTTIPGEGDPGYIYYSWIELRETTAQDVLAAYKPRTGANADGKTYLLGEIKEKSTPGWFTVFVNEYVYETTAGDESGSTNWHNYVNYPERRAWINVEAEFSEDGRTMHYKSKYAISQQSIQTFYSSLSPTGLGLEHTNETLGVNLRNSFNPPSSSTGKNKTSGRYNMAWYIAGSSTWSDDAKAWSNYVDFTTPQLVHAVNNQNVVREAHTATSNVLTVPNVVTRSVSESVETQWDPDQTSSPYIIEAITACLNRNRDLDGDGYISADELRWFIPTTNQILAGIVGEHSLDNPIFETTGIDRLPNNSCSDNAQNSSMLCYTSDGNMIWMMEGTSYSGWRQWGGGAPWQVRCARAFGINQSIVSDSNVPTLPYVLRSGTNIVDLGYLEERSLRNEAFLRADYPMPVHTTDDYRYNRCYQSFEVFDSVIPLNDARIGISSTTIEWASYLSSNNPCHALNYTGKTGWRVPNQKELTVIASVGLYNKYVPSGNVYQISCTYSYFDFSGYAPGKNPDDPTATGSVNGSYRFPMKIISSTGNGTQSETMKDFVPSGTYYGIRCVRDITD